MIKIATCLWQPNEHSKPFSRCYDQTWVEKLYRGFSRNLTLPFEFVCFTDKKYWFSEPIKQVAITADEPDYGCMIEPFSLSGPKIVVGLDTVVLGNVDYLARYCLEGATLALPKDPYEFTRSINAIALVPAGNERIYSQWCGENDMDWLRQFEWKAIDDMWPDKVISLKAHDVRRRGTRDADVVYFHGKPKPNDLTHLDWIKEHWR